MPKFGYWTGIFESETLKCGRVDFIHVNFMKIFENGNSKK
jgi:hypothetical protein